MLEFIDQQRTLFWAGFSFFLVVLIWCLNRALAAFPSPVNKLIVRWLRFLVIGTGTAILLYEFALQEAELWRLMVVGLLGWILIESVYLWIFVGAWNRSEYPLFPSLKTADFEWPANRRYLAFKDFVRERGYEEIGSIQSSYGNNLFQNSIFYQDRDRSLVLQIMVLPDPNGVILDQVAFFTEGAGGQRYITDNIVMPFGGFYPDNWSVDRKPMLRKIQSLEALHLRKTRNVTEKQVPEADELLSWLDESQSTIESHNIGIGLIHPEKDREEFGKLSGDGKYRVWMESFLLNYLGRSLI